MAVPETRAVRGGVRLTFFSAVGGDPGEGGRFGGLGERGYEEEAEKEGKIRSHFRQKGVVGTQTTRMGRPGKLGHLINNRKCLGLWM